MKDKTSVKVKYYSLKLKLRTQTLFFFPDGNIAFICILNSITHLALFPPIPTPSGEMSVKGGKLLTSIKQKPYFPPGTESHCLNLLITMNCPNTYPLIGK